MNTPQRQALESQINNAATRDEEIGREQV
ncbi:hypothetical protein [Staphylococcus aureus]